MLPDRQTGRQTVRQTDRQTDRQTNRQRYRKAKEVESERKKPKTCELTGRSQTNTWIWSEERTRPIATGRVHAALQVTKIGQSVGQSVGQSIDQSVSQFIGHFALMKCTNSNYSTFKIFKNAKNRPTDRPTDTVTYWVSCTQLKRRREKEEEMRECLETSGIAP